MMIGTPRIGVALFSAAALALGLASAGSAEEMVETVSYEKFIEANPFEHSVISEAGKVVLLSIADASADLEKNQYQRAMSEARKSRKLLQLIRKASPSASLDDGLAAARAKVVSDAGGNPSDLVPIYAHLEAYERIDAAEDVRTWVDKAKGSLAAGQKEEAVVALEKASASIRYVEIDLPVKETLVRVNRSISQMQRKDYLAAKAALRDSETHLTTFAKVASIQLESATAAVGAAPPE